MFWAKTFALERKLDVAGRYADCAVAVYARIAPVVADLARLRGGEKLDVRLLQRHRATAGSLPLAALAAAMAASFGS